MSVPNGLPTVQAVFDSWPLPLVTVDDIGRFTEAAAVELHKTDRRFGHLRKNPGQTQYNGHAANAVLYLSDTPGQSTAVDIMRVGVSNPVPRWLEDIPRYGPSDWFAPVFVPVQTCRLGCSAFPLIAMFQRFRSQLDANLRYIKTDLGADFVRAIGVLGGDLFGGIDPWQALATDWRASTFVQDVRDVQTHLRDTFGLKVAWTLVGGRAQVEREEHQNAVVDRFSDAFDPASWEYAEMWNEWEVNNALRHELRNMARRLRGRLPAGFPIALSSPNSLMGGNASAATVDTEIAAMYGGDSGANLITIHPTRPEPIWNAETVGRLPAAQGFQLAIGEPRGPGASAGGDVDNPIILGLDYQSAGKGHARSHVYHPKAGIWFGRCNGFPNENVPANIFEHRNAVSIAATLKQIRASGSTPTTPPGDTMKPYPDEPTWWKTIFKERVKAQYAEAQRPLDDDFPVWFSRTAYDVCAGLTKEASADKHIQELRAALGLPPAA